MKIISTKEYNEAIESMIEANEALKTLIKNNKSQSKRIEKLEANQDKQMIEFAKWIKHNCNCFDSSPIFYYHDDNKDSEPKTELELLELFKKFNKGAD
jgi:hypothetical protein